MKDMIYPIRVRVRVRVRVRSMKDMIKTKRHSGTRVGWLISTARNGEFKQGTRCRFFTYRTTMCDPHAVAIVWFHTHGRFFLLFMEPKRPN